MLRPTNSERTTAERLLKMLISKDKAEADRAASICLQIGLPAAELLIQAAGDKRFAIDARVRFLQVVREIGVPLNMAIGTQLQQLMEGRSKKIAKEAAQIVADASPNGAAGIMDLPAITRKPFGWDAMVARRRRDLAAATRGARAEARAERRAWLRQQ